MYNPFASFAGAFVVYTILFFQNTEVILYGSMPYTKHIFNILTSNSRVIFDNSYNHIKSFLRRQFFRVTFSVFGAIFGAIFGVTFSVLEGTFGGTFGATALYSFNGEHQGDLIHIQAVVQNRLTPTSRFSLSSPHKHLIEWFCPSY